MLIRVMLFVFLTLGFAGAAPNFLGQRTIPPGSSNLQTPGPSLALYNAQTYYTCVNNISVTNLAQLQAQVSGTHSPGDCINISPGIYTVTGTNPLQIAHGGSAPTSGATFPATTYVVWRCTTMPFSYSGGALQGEGTGCVIRQSGSNPGAIFFTIPSYTMFDGIELDGNSDAVGQACADDEHSNGAHHHIWFFNMDIHGCGQGGLQINQTDWIYAIHNHIHDNSQTGGNGSGISIYEPVLTASYTLTTQDNTFQSSTAGVTFHIVTNYNVLVHNWSNYTACTDAEGIIFDDWGWLQAVGTPFAGHGLAMGNASWYNGGGGVQVYSETSGVGQIWLVNNSVYDNYFETCNTGTWRGDLYQNASWNVHAINNAAQAVIGTGLNAGNLPILGHCSTACGTNVWQTNIALPGTTAAFDSPNTYPTVGTNHNLDNTDPKFTSVTPNSMSNNFALQATSPAIGFGQAFDLWQQSGTIDVGACPYSAPGPVTNCP